jgi:hypothetical protein
MTDQQRIEFLTDALKRLMRHEPWPPSIQSEGDYENARIILTHTRVSLPEDRREAMFDSQVSRKAGADE